MSTAVGTEVVSKVVGYKLLKGDFSESTPNLPQRIVVLGEANDANQLNLDTTAKQVVTAQEAGELYGFGSPIYAMMRILKPFNSAGVGGIPIFVHPQAKAAGATEKIMEIIPTGVATANGVHKVVIAGRSGLDGVSYNVNINKGDTGADIVTKISDAVNNVLGSPMTASDYDPSKAELTSKWSGKTANDLQVKIDTQDKDLGVSYVINTTQTGSATPGIQDALDQFKKAWTTIVVNGYGTETEILDALEAFNGIPDPENPTGRYQGIVFKPFIALTGSTAEDPSAITDARKQEVTIAICPAPLSEGMQYEAAANMALLFARISQDTPNLDVAEKSYLDMPTPSDIGKMEDFDERDAIVKKGCSTVDLVDGKYVVKDFVSTYHPVGEIPPQFRYCRNLMLDFNVRYGYFILEQLYVEGHSLAKDTDKVTAAKVIKPKHWNQIVRNYARELVERGLLVDLDFFKANIKVQLSATNPDRFDTTFKYKRSGFARILSTDAEAGFNFGSL